MSSKYPRGSEWEKVDLHLHTPASYDWDNNCKDGYEGVLNKAISERLSLIVISDHHSIKGIEEINKFAKGKNISVLPGVELRTDKGNKAIHIIGIFNKSLTPKMIYDKLLCPLNFSENDIKTKGDEQVYCNFEDACEKIHQLGGLVLLHAGNKSNGIEQLDSDIRATLKKDLASLVDIFEVSSEKNVKDYREIVFPKIKQDFPCIITSDSVDRSQLQFNNGHSIEVIGKKYSWIKAEPTFEGLREILCEPVLRVSLDLSFKSYLHPQLTFIKLEVPNQYLDNKILIKDRFCLAKVEKIFFSPNLNALIGGRATGKSTLLELLGFVFDKYQISEDSKKLSIIENLRNKYPEVKIIIGFKFGEKEYIVEKKLSEDKADLFGFDIIYLPQDELEKRASDDNEITDLINTLIDESKLVSHKSILTNKVLSLEKYRATYSQKFAKEKELKDAQEELKKIQLVLNFAQSDQYKALVESLSLKIKEREKINGIISEIEWQVGILNKTNQELEQNIGTDLTGISDYLNNAELYGSLKTKEKISAMILFLEGGIKEIKESNNYKKLLLDIKGLHEKYILACKELGIDSINQAKIKEALESKGKIEIKIRQLEQELKLINAAKDPHDKELLSVKKADAEYKILENTLINNAKSKFGVNLEICITENKEKLEEKIIDLFIHYQKLSGRYGLKETDIKSIIAGLSLADIVKYLKDNKIPNGVENEKKNNDHKITAQFFFTDSNFLYRELLIMNLEEILSESNFIVTFRGKKLHEMSFGERCGVVLRLILSNSNLPLIIDQPEDHLDNKYIVKELLELIKTKKEGRQILFSTHNPNIVVNGDSELITGLELDLKEGYSNVNSGSLENKEVRNLITNTLEGGRDAFLKREQKYDFNNT